MKNYIKPEISVENLFSASAVAGLSLSLTGGSDDNEVEISATGWWDILK